MERSRRNTPRAYEFERCICLGMKKPGNECRRNAETQKRRLIIILTFASHAHMLGKSLPWSERRNHHVEASFSACVLLRSSIGPDPSPKRERLR